MQLTFHCNSHYGPKQIELPGMEAESDMQETNLPTYWNISFFKICIDIKIDQPIRFIVVNKTANS